LTEASADVEAEHVDADAAAVKDEELESVMRLRRL